MKVIKCKDRSAVKMEWRLLLKAPKSSQAFNSSAQQKFGLYLRYPWKLLMQVL